ncbi:MAG: ATP-binding cassette domain-containing protein [Candidatus Aenigmatarchaeota archaeon]
MPVIETKDLGKDFKVLKKKAGLGGALRGLASRKYKTVRALHDVNISIEEGEFVGIIGPNGAGKSTAIKILTGILNPSKGEAKCLGYVPYKERKRYVKNIGVVFGQRTQLWWDLPAQDSFELLKGIFQVPEKVYRSNMRKFKKVLDIHKYMLTPVRKLSLGERMRCDIAASLLHNPRMVFLDEPTIGLDIDAKFRIREFLKERNRKGTTIILTTHDMGDIEELCPRTIIIDKGTIIYDGPTEKIREKVVTEKSVKVDYLTKAPRFKLPRGVRVKKREKTSVTYLIDRRKTSVSGFIKNLFSKYKVEDIAIDEPSIEEIIRKIYLEGI